MFTNDQRDVVQVGDMATIQIKATLTKLSTKRNVHQVTLTLNVCSRPFKVQVEYDIGKLITLIMADNLRNYYSELTAFHSCRNVSTVYRVKYSTMTLRRRQSSD